MPAPSAVISVPICSRRQHLVEARALDVEDLAAQRQHRLELAVAALLGGAAGRIALDDEDLGLGRVALLTVGELAGQARDVERALAARELARLARRLARLRRLDHLADDDPRLLRMLLEPLREEFVDEPLDDRPHLGGDELVLRLGREFRIRAFDAEHAGEALAGVVAGEIDLLLLEQPRAFGIADDLTGQRAAQADEMRAAVALRDVVGERQHVLVVAVVPPQSDFDADAVALALDEDRLIDQRGLGAVEIAHEGLEAALVVELLALGLGMAQIGQHDPDARIEEGELAQAMLDGRVVELDHGEGFGRGGERDLGAALRLAVDDRRRSDDLERRDRVAAGEFDEVLEPVAPDAQHEPGRQRIDDRNADAVQAARDLVGVLVEFSARMQLGHDDFGGRHAFFVVDAGRNAAPVVGDGARAVGVERHGHELRMAGQRLVDGVVDHLVDHVVEAGAVVGVADVHARPLAHGVQAAQHLDRIRAVALAGGLGVVGQVLAFVVQHQSLFLWAGSRTAKPRFAISPPYPARPANARFAGVAAVNSTAAAPAQPIQLTIYWRSKRFFQWRRPSSSSSGSRRGEFAPRRGAQQRLVAGDGAQAESRARAWRGRRGRRSRTSRRIFRAPSRVRRPAAPRS